MIQDWSGKRVTVMGLGRFGGGVGVARWLAGQGAEVLVTDAAPAEKLAESTRELAGLDVRLRLGGHDEPDFRDCDLVVVSPAVPESSPYLAIAAGAGVPITTEMNLFLERCPAECVGVTGSVGKSTVAAMIGHVLQKSMPDRNFWLGGNIGKSLLDDLPQINARDIVVLELSSFQLQRTPAVRWSPHIAVITNIAPNHLDWHGTFAAYLAAKMNIVRFQDPQRDAIVIGDTPELRRNFDLMFGDVAGMWRYGMENGAPRAVMQSQSAVDCDDRLLHWENLKLRVPGRHNRENAAAALTVASILGIWPETAVTALASFEALPHRLQHVGTRNGVMWYDDSKSTTPESAITAMDSFEEGTPLLVILGGYDKGVDLATAAKRAAQRAKFAACIGQTGRTIADRIRQAGGEAEYVGELRAAVAACRVRATAGDAVLLSPACASWDQFADFRARGELFARLLNESDLG